MTQPEISSQIEHAVNNPNMLIAEACKRNFFRFVQEFWDTIISDKPVYNWHIPFLCDELEKVFETVRQRKPRKYDLVINVPPGSSKSSIVTIFFPIWCWINCPWVRFIAGSYSSPLALKLSGKCKDVVDSQKFAILFPYVRVRRDRGGISDYELEYDQWNKKGEYLETKIGGGRYSTSVGGTVTGYHAHIILIDDPLDPKRAVSPVQLKTANDWMEQTLPTRKVDKETTPVILIMQRLHEDDPSQRMVDANEDIPVKHICLPGEYRKGIEVKPNEVKANYKKGLLDPIRMSSNVLKELEARLGQYGYAGQILQMPTPPEGGMFKTDKFKIIKQLPSRIVKAIRYWDMAATEGAGCFTAGVLWVKLADGQHGIIDVRKGQWAPVDREAIIRTTAELDGRDTKIWIEQEPGASGKESVEASIKNLIGYRAYADRPQGNKIYRADPLSVQVNLGNIFLLEGEWNKAYLQEMNSFPFGKFMDQADASAAGFIKMTTTKRAGAMKR